MCQVRGPFGSSLSGRDLRRQTRTIDTIAEHGDPSSDREHDSILAAQADAEPTAPADPVLQGRATATIKRLLEEHPAVDKEIRDTLRTRVYLRELAGRTSQAEAAEADAEQREANLAVKLDPGDHRKLDFGLGFAIVVALVILDAVPLNWAAQAFGLNSAGTMLVTFILVVASVGAMLGFELTRARTGRRRALTAVLVAGYLALLGLRTEFLATVSTGSLLVAFLQSALLTAISAGLVWCGSAVLARTRFLHQSRARAAAQRAARLGEETRAARLLADDTLERNIAVLHRMLFQWALDVAPPQGIDHAQWSGALDGAVHELFRAP